MSEAVLIERKGRVAVASLNRPEALNALNAEVMHLLSDGLGEFDADPAVGRFIITGSAKAFATGVDVKEMADASFTEVFANSWFACWEAIANLRTPVIAAVSGFALGRGCELAMMCDMINALFSTQDKAEGMRAFIEKKKPNFKGE